MKALLMSAGVLGVFAGLFSPVSGQAPPYDPFGGGFSMNYKAEVFSMGAQNDSLHGWALDWPFNDDSLVIGESSFPESYLCGHNRDMAKGDFDGDNMDEVVIVWDRADGGVFVGLPTLDPVSLIPDPSGWNVPIDSCPPGVLYATESLTDILGEIRVVAGNFYPDHAMEFVLAYLAADSTVTLSVFDVDTLTLIPEEMATISNQAVNTDLPALQQFGAVSRFDIAAGDFDGDGLDEVALVVNDPAVSPATDLVLRIYDYDPLSHDLISGEKIPYAANSDVDHTCLRNVLMETGNFEPDSLDEIAILDSWSWTDVDSSRVGTLHTVKLNTEMDDIYDSQMQSLPSCSWQNDAGMFGPNGPVRIMTIYDGDLIVGGKFNEVGGFAANARNIASWDGTRWKPLGAGVNDTVEALAVYKGELIVGGSFTEAGGVPANHLARWDGTSWEEFNGGANNTVYDLLASVSVSEGSLFACGDFTTVDTTSAARIARWDGTDWQQVASGLINGRALEMMENGIELVVTGAFHWIDGTDRWYIVYWSSDNQTVWNYYGKGLLLDPNNDGGYGHALVDVPNGDVIAGGNFNHCWGFITWPANWIHVDNIAIYGDATDDYWHPVGDYWYGQGMNGHVYDLVSDPDNDSVIYAGGAFTEAYYGSVAAKRIARWQWPSGNWVALGSGVTATTGDSAVVDMCFYKGDLIAGGMFDHAGGIDAWNIARWDGSQWHALCQSDSQPPVFSIGLAVGRFNAESGLDDIAVTACATDLGFVRQYLRVYGVDTLKAPLALSERGETNLSGYCTDSVLARSRRIIAIDDVDTNGQVDLAVLYTEFSNRRIDIYEPCDINNNCTFDPMPRTGSWISGSDSLTQLVLADLDTLSVIIGPPTAYHLDSVKQPVALVYAPPVHYDVLDGNVCDLSYRYTPPPDPMHPEYWDTYVQYTNSISVSLTTETRFHRDWGVSYDVEAMASNGGFSVSAYLNAKYGNGFSNIEDSTTTITFGTTISARNEDQLRALMVSYDILEYPVFRGGELRGYIVVVSPAPSFPGWYPVKNYESMIPNHEVENILSYPGENDIQANPMIDTTMEGILGGAQGWTMQNMQGSSWWVSKQVFTQSSVSESYDVKIEAGISVGIGGGITRGWSGSWQANLAGSYGWGQVSTSTTTFGYSDSLHVTYGWINTGSDSTNREYIVTPYAYWASNGALVIDYAVRPFADYSGQNPTWWQIHYSLPDPGFLLPWRLANEKEDTDYPEDNRYRTKEMTFSPSFPSPGETVLIGTRIHNFSLSPTPAPVKVSFYLGNPDNGGTILHDINTGDTIFTAYDTLGMPIPIPAQGWALAEMAWQVPDVGSINACQRIWALIDPLDEITPEVHDNDGFATNNKGWKLLYVNTPVDCIDTDGDDWEDPAFRCNICPYEFDNCPTVYNDDQADSDLDGIGDACEEVVYVCGDANNEGNTNILDITYLIAYLYKGGPPPQPDECVGDVNGTDTVNILDITYLIAFLYKGGPPPVEDCCSPVWK